MQLSTAFAITALIASVICLGGSRVRVLAIIAACISGLEVAIAFRVVTFGISGISVSLILGAALLVVGALMFARTQAKTQIAAATLVTAIGLLQALGAMKLVKF